MENNGRNSEEEEDENTSPAMSTSSIVTTLIRGPNIYRYINRPDAVLLSEKGYEQAGHVMIHAPAPDVKLFGFNPVRHAVMMQMRFDGFLGFPGGYLDANDKSWEEGICRELREELGKKYLGFTLSPSDYLISHACDTRKLCLHFYTKEISYEKFKEIEVRDSDDDGDFENLGVVKVPLFLMSNKTSGFPNFLRNNFIEIAKEQLVYGLKCRNLIPPDELKHYLTIAKELSAQAKY